MKRRTFVKLLGLGAVAGTGYYYFPDEGIFNPCLDSALPNELLEHDIVNQAWDGIDPNLYRDIHTHLIGVGDSDSGIYIHPSMQDMLSPLQYVRYVFYINAACADRESGIDKGYIETLIRLMKDFPTGARSMVMAFDYNYDADGQRNKDKSPFYTPNTYAQAIAGQNSDRFDWIASIHPYREDSVSALQMAIQHGARAVKWLPPVMGIDPASEKCDRFYDAMVKYNMPLLTHAGDEHAFDNVDAQHFGNPLRLRRALDHGVRVIVAHCASEGKGADLDKGQDAPEVSNFDLFSRMMGEKKYEKLLFGEISAMTQLNRIGSALQAVLTRDDWQHRLLNGSDYPLPGVMPLFSTLTMSSLGYLKRSAVKPLEKIRRYNPMLYDFVLKRHLHWQGKKFAGKVFETENFFKENKKIMIG